MSRASSPECSAIQAALSSAADDVVLNAGQRRHVKLCSACQVYELEHSALASELGAALRPEPLESATLARVYARLATVRVARRPERARLPVVLIRLASFAAAAGLMLALVRPLGTPNATVSPAHTTIDAQARAAIALALADVGRTQAGWSDTIAETTDAVDMDSDLGDAAGIAEARRLPWSEEDDWDLPQPPAGVWRENGLASAT